MNQLSNTEAIVLSEPAAALERETDRSTPNLLRAAMKATHNHWMVLDEDVQFRMAVGAVLLVAPEEDREILTGELKSLQILSAIMSGVPVDIASVKIPEKSFGLMKMWHQVKQIEPD